MQKNTVRQIFSKMKSYICILFAFVTLSASAQPNRCSECWAIGETECCNANTRECRSNRCMTISEYCKLDGKEYQTIRKTCGDGMSCDKCLFITSEKDTRFEACAECCTGNNCNADLNYSRTSKGEPNGYVCPSCYRNDTLEGCDPGSNIITCTGEQTECLDYGAFIQFSDDDAQPVSINGCITKDGCQLGIKFFPGVNELYRKKMICTPAKQLNTL